jgi:hypothetical protein
VRVEAKGAVIWGPHMFCVANRRAGGCCSPSLHIAPCLRFEQSCSLAHPRHFLPCFYSILRRSFSLHKPVHAFIRALSPQSFSPPHPYSLSLFALAWLFPYSLVLFLLRPSIYHMAATVRQPKPKKGYPGDNSSTRSVTPPLPHFALSVNPFTVPCSRQPAWGGARSSPSFSPSPNNARLPNGPPPATSNQAVSFPPLGPSTPTPRQDHKVVLQNLAGLTVRVIYHQPITVGSLCSLLKRGRQSPLSPRPQNAMKVSSLPLPRARVTQPVLPFVMQRSSPPLVLPSRVNSSSHQQI